MKEFRMLAMGLAIGIVTAGIKNKRAVKRYFKSLGYSKKESRDMVQAILKNKLEM